MLHKSSKIIATKTLNLIQQLQALPELDGFHLVDGSALALQMGHLNSVDIDLFSQKNFDENFLIYFINKKYLFEKNSAERIQLLALLTISKLISLLMHTITYNLPLPKKALPIFPKKILLP